jgi:hypothetical protein
MMMGTPLYAKKFEVHYGAAIKDLVHEKVKWHTIVVHEVERPAGGNTRSHGSGEAGADPDRVRGKARAPGKGDRESEHGDTARA